MGLPPGLWKSRVAVSIYESAPIAFCQEKDPVPRAVGVKLFSASSRALSLTGVHPGGADQHGQCQPGATLQQVNLQVGLFSKLHLSTHSILYVQYTLSHQVPSNK